MASPYGWSDNGSNKEPSATSPARFSPVQHQQDDATPRGSVQGTPRSGSHRGSPTATVDSTPGADSQPSDRSPSPPNRRRPTLRSVAVSTRHFLSSQTRATILQRVKAAKQRWTLVANHIRGGSFHPGGIARGGTQGGPISRASTHIFEAVRRLLRGAQWLAAAAQLARVVNTSIGGGLPRAPVVSHGKVRKCVLGALHSLIRAWGPDACALCCHAMLLWLRVWLSCDAGACCTCVHQSTVMLKVNNQSTTLTWRDIVQVLARPDIVGSAHESIIRKAHRERVLCSIFDRAELEADGLAEVGELRRCGHGCVVVCVVVWLCWVWHANPLQTACA